MGPWHPRARRPWKHLRFYELASQVRIVFISDWVGDLACVCQHSERRISTTKMRGENVERLSAVYGGIRTNQQSSCMKDQI